MTLSPSFEVFDAGFARGENQLVWARLAADLDTPVSLMLKLAGARSDSFMLESVTGGEVRGRYSVVGLKPDLIWQCRGETSRINRQARFDAAAIILSADQPEWSMLYAEETAVARVAPGLMIGLVHQAEMRWDRWADRALQVRNPGSHRRPTASRRVVLALPRHGFVGVVRSASADDRTNRHELVHHAGNHRKLFPDFDARDIRLDRLELASNFRGSI